MTYPASDVNRTNADASTDSPATFRSDALDLIDKFNLLRNHISSFMQGLLASANAAAVRTALDVPTITGGGATGNWNINAANAIGAGQVWRDVTGSRAASVNYTSPGRPIEICVVVSLVPGSTAQLSIGGVGTDYLYTSAYGANMLRAVIPPSTGYVVLVDGGATVSAWRELS
ncbi:hypothetical protein [Rhodoferax sp. WC2427]|uniref:hypothetical protein n=1 Tax=Rhodoferax sp. WC2427 TaxID=3234144 RepID=UPI00346601CD